MFLYFLGIDVKYNVFQWSKDKEYIKSACLNVTYTAISIQSAYKNQCSSILQFLQAPTASYFFSEKMTLFQAIVVFIQRDPFSPES